MDATHHMGEEEFERYSMGLMPEGDIASFEEHLLICEPCQHRLAETDAYVAAMRRASARLGENRPKRGLPWLLLPQRALVPALAGLAALVVVAGLWMSRVDSGQAQPFAIDLEATRGTAIEAKAPPGRRLLLRLNLENLPASSGYRLEMVDGSGKRVWQAAAPVGGPKAVIEVPGRQPGVYFVRAYGPSGELLREYGFEVEGRM